MKFLPNFFIVLFFTINMLHSQTTQQEKVQEQQKNVQKQQENVQEQQKNVQKQQSKTIKELQKRIETINSDLKNNIWITRYNNYFTYRQIEKNLKTMRIKAKRYSHWKGSKYKELSYQLYNKIKIKENELELISEYKDSPIGKQIKPAIIPPMPKVTNPIVIVEAWSYIRQLRIDLQKYQSIKLQLIDLKSKIGLKYNLTKQLYEYTKNQETKQSLQMLKQELKDFSMVVDIVSTTSEVYAKKIKQITQELNNAISNEIEKTTKVIVLILILALITYGTKFGLKKYIDDDDRHYKTNKIINFVFILLTILILLFSYIQNVSYLVTILGFASAGIAIALKDWFMSIFGWVSIMTGGYINPGDRVKVMRNGIEVVGDVLDITLLKIAIREDTTLTSYSKNRRTGRVFFIPNNYVFTDMISNYTFDGLRTVWDVVDICITFDSNHKKAVAIAKEVANKLAKPYTDLAKKRLQKMRKKYVLRNSNPEPRIFAFAESYGIVISTWFHTNSHATLGLRSSMGMEILDAFMAEDDIHIAYPTQTLKFNSSSIDHSKITPPQDIDMSNRIL
jgi:small-conductance mechanosensitive channel